jgi:hypothetical protein
LVAHEPFNIEPWAYALDGLAKHWFTYAPALPQDAALEAFDKVLRRRTRKIFLKNQPQYWFPAQKRPHDRQGSDRGPLQRLAREKR